MLATLIFGLNIDIGSICFLILVAWYCKARWRSMHGKRSKGKHIPTPFD